MAETDAKEKVKMRWHASRAVHLYSLMGYYYARLEDGTEIEVDPTIYEKQLNVYLACIGVKQTCWLEIMRKAEREWNEYCQIMDAFAQDCQQWLDYQGNGVFIEHPDKKGEQ